MYVSEEIFRGKSTDKIYTKLLTTNCQRFIFGKCIPFFLVSNLTKGKSRGLANTGLIIPISLRETGLLRVLAAINTPLIADKKSAERRFCVGNAQGHNS